MSRTLAICAAALGAACHAVPGGSGAEAGGPEHRWELGYRAGVALGDGEPSNDIPIPVGVVGRYRFDERWSLAASLELSKGDYERPYEIAGEQSTQEIDGEAEWTTFALWGERTFSSPGSANAWFVLVGVGYASVDVDDPAPGPLVGGGTFDIRTDAEDELVLSAGGGYRRRLGSAWSLEALVRYDEHFGDWQVRDVNTGQSGSIDDYGALALLLGLAFGF
jgi:hypothetical protein